MKTLYLLIPIWMLFYTGAVAQQYARWAKLKAGAPPIMRDAIPTASEVGIPVYPEAVVLSVSSMPDGSGGKIPFMNLASEETPEKVEVWYKERLSEILGWKYHDTYEFFYQGEDAMIAMSMQSPYVNVMELSQDAIDMIYVDESVKKDLKTRIQIVYRPSE